MFVMVDTLARMMAVTATHFQMSEPCRRGIHTVEASRSGERP